MLFLIRWAPIGLYMSQTYQCPFKCSDENDFHHKVGKAGIGQQLEAPNLDPVGCHATHEILIYEFR